jgi:hypothetical protein
MTIAESVGTTFHDGGKFTTGFMVRKSARPTGRFYYPLRITAG